MHSRLHTACERRQGFGKRRGGTAERRRREEKGDKRVERWCSCRLRSGQVWKGEEEEEERRAEERWRPGVETELLD